MDNVLWPRRAQYQNETKYWPLIGRNSVPLLLSEKWRCRKQVSCVHVGKTSCPHAPSAQVHLWVVAGHGGSVNPAHWMDIHRFPDWAGCYRDVEKESGDIGKRRARLSVMWRESQLHEIMKIKQWMWWLTVHVCKYPSVLTESSEVSVTVFD